MALDLVLTEEQQELRKSVRRLLEENVSHEGLRATPVAEFDRGLWHRIAEMGLPALEVPEELGGLGMGAVESWLVLEEMGRALYNGPYLTSLLAIAALLGTGDEQACQDLLPGIAEGTTIATLAVAGPDGDWQDHGRVAASLQGSEWSLTGSRHFVVHGADADLLLVVARTSGGPSLFVVLPGSAGVEATALEALDLSRPLATVTFQSAPARLVGHEGDAADLLDHVYDRAIAAQAAEQAGGAQRCLEMSVEHAKTRVQFGAAIGSFQAIAHKCSDMLLHAELAKASAQYAATCADQSPTEFPAASRVAAITATKAFTWVTTETIQVHGGTGFTWEHDAHLYYRRSRSSAQLFGAVDRHAAALATLSGA